MTTSLGQGPLVSSSRSRDPSLPHWYSPKRWFHPYRFLARMYLGKKLYKPLYEMRNGPVLQVILKQKKNLLLSAGGVALFGLGSLGVPIFLGELVGSAGLHPAVWKVAQEAASTVVSYVLEVSGRTGSGGRANRVRVAFETGLEKLIPDNYLSGNRVKDTEKPAPLLNEDVPTIAEAIGNATQFVARFRTVIATAFLVPFLSFFTGGISEVYAGLSMLAPVAIANGLALSFGSRQAEKVSAVGDEVKAHRKDLTDEMDKTVTDNVQGRFLQGLPPRKIEAEMAPFSSISSAKGESSTEHLKAGVDGVRKMRFLSMLGLVGVLAVGVLEYALTGELHVRSISEMTTVDFVLQPVVLGMTHWTALVQNATSSGKKIDKALEQVEIDRGHQRSLLRAGVFDLRVEINDQKLGEFSLSITSKPGIVRLLAADENALTATLETLTGFSDKGTVTIGYRSADGTPDALEPLVLQGDRTEFNRYVGYSPRVPGFLQEKNLTIRDQFRAYSPRIKEERLKRAWEGFEIDVEKLDSSIDSLSASEKQVVATLRLLLGNHRILFFDRPYDPLDDVHKAALSKEFAKAASAGKKIVITSTELQPPQTVIVEFGPDNITVKQPSPSKVLSPYADIVTTPSGVTYVNDRMRPSYVNWYLPREPWKSHAAAGPEGKDPFSLDQIRQGQILPLPSLGNERFSDVPPMQLVPILASQVHLLPSGSVPALELLKAAGAKESSDEGSDDLENLDRLTLARMLKEHREKALVGKEREKVESRVEKPTVELWAVPNDYVVSVPEHRQQSRVAESTHGISL